LDDAVENPNLPADAVALFNIALNELKWIDKLIDKTSPERKKLLNE